MTRHVHFLGIAGYAVSGAALMAREMGYVVTGSDEDAYPPTTDMLDAARIPWERSHSADNLVRHGLPHLVVVGNQVREGNVEWEAARRRGVPVTSEAEFYAELTSDRIRLAVCGTHGKTTTASLLAWMLDRAGMNPGFRLGSTSRDLGSRAARLGTGPFVFEGDEYTTAPWDPRPKFLHAHPHAAAVTRLELDHPDVYRSFAHYREAFVELAQAMPANGLLVLNADDAEVLQLAAGASSPVLTYGRGHGADWRIEQRSPAPATQRFRVVRGDAEPLEVELAIPGAHNAENATAALALASYARAPLQPCFDACRSFRGASRRFEIAGEVAGVTVVDDYAHHPTEVAATIAAARERFPDGRVIAIHVPHTYSRTLALLDGYRTCFEGASLVLLGPIEPARERHLAHTVSSEDVAERARLSTDVSVVASPEEAIDIVLRAAHHGDVVLCMTVRGFDNVAARTVEALRSRDG